MRGVTAMAMSIAVAGLAPASAQSVKDGADAWQRGDYPAAVRSWRPLAEKGDGDAAFDLAQAYKLGRGVPLDLGQAKTWYGSAARAGHPQGIANYGLLLFQDGDRRAAIPWLDKASAAGDPRAQYVMGTALFNGDLAARDWPRAYALMTRAAAAGLPQATTSLSQMDRFLSAADKAKAAQLAAAMAAQPMPPIGRQLVTTAAITEPARAAHSGPPPAAKPVPASVPTRTATVSPPAPAATITEPARSKPAPPSVSARPAVTAGGRWQVQLGAFGSETAAKVAWTGLTAKAAALRPLHPAYVKAGAVVRLRAGGLSDRTAAEHACAAAKAAGAACFPVAAGS